MIKRLDPTPWSNSGDFEGKKTAESSSAKSSSTEPLLRCRGVLGNGAMKRPAATKATKVFGPKFTEAIAETEG